MNSSRNQRLPAAAILMALLTLVPPASAPAADDYLSILEAEANDTGSVATAVAAPPPPKPVQPGRHITPDLDFEAFEDELRSRYAGTHLLYMKLSAANRRAAWKLYRKDNALSALRENIVALMSSG
jgi:hypothetical protein